MRNIEKLRRKADARELLYLQKPTQQSKERLDRTVQSLLLAEANERECVRYHQQVAYQRSLDW